MLIADSDAECRRPRRAEQKPRWRMFNKRVSRLIQPEEWEIVIKSLPAAKPRSSVLANRCPRGSSEPGTCAAFNGRHSAIGVKSIQRHRGAGRSTIAGYWLAHGELLP